MPGASYMVSSMSSMSFRVLASTVLTGFDTVRSNGSGRVMISRFAMTLEIGDDRKGVNWAPKPAKTNAPLPAGSPGGAANRGNSGLQSRHFRRGPSELGVISAGQRFASFL